MINIGKYIETAINWLTENFAPLFDAINVGIGGFIDGFQNILMWIPFYVTIALLAILAWYKSGKGVSIFTILGLLLIWGMGFWNETMQTLALVLSSTIIALIMGLPLGIWSANSKRCDKILHPILDLMQTMPAFVYLIPAVLFFGLGTVPGAFATIIFAMPPVVRLTSLGIKQVPKNVIEASRSFGATPMQLLFKVQLPLALPTIMTGINQTILMSLSMVVIAAMIAAGGLGEIVLKGITQMKIGLGFEGGIAVVILAIILDRITQGLGKTKGKGNKHEENTIFFVFPPVRMIWNVTKLPQVSPLPREIQAGWDPLARSMTGTDMPRGSVSPLQGGRTPLYLHTLYTDSIAVSSFSKGKDAAVRMTRAARVSAENMYDHFGVSAYAYTGELGREPDDTQLFLQRHSQQVRQRLYTIFRLLLAGSFLQDEVLRLCTQRERPVRVFPGKGRPAPPYQRDRAGRGEPTGGPADSPVIRARGKQQHGRCADLQPCPDRRQIRVRE